MPRSRYWLTQKSEKMNKIRGLYKKLYKKHGWPRGQWKMWCKRPKTLAEREEIMIGAILTQRTNWNNVEQAIALLKKKNVCSLEGICELGQNNIKRLAGLIKPSGFYQQKAERLFGLAKFILENYGGIEKMKKAGINRLREELLNLKGLGRETVDSILLYTLDKPVFVIDEYTRRFVKRYRLAKNLSYDNLQGLFEKNLKKDYRLYQDFHALIIIDEKTPLGQKMLFH